MVPEVIPGIHQIKVPLPMAFLPYVLVYCIKGDDGYTLVDCGWNTDEAWEALTGQLGEIGVDIKDIAHLIVTHIHPDHYGLAGRIKKASGAEVIMHEREQRLLDSRYLHPEELLRRVRAWLTAQGVPAGLAEEMHTASLPARDWVTMQEPDTQIRGGENFRIGGYTLEATWTPGHTPGHICLVEHNAGFMMTGDHVLPTITPNISLHPQQTGNPLQDYLESLDKLKPLNIRRGFAAHEYIIEDLPARLDGIKEHHEVRLGEMMSALTDGAETCYEVASAIAWGPGHFNKFGNWQKRAAMAETLAHLEFARSRGMVDVEEKEGVMVYTLAGER